VTTTAVAGELHHERRVVVGVSGSRASFAALAQAAREAELRNALLHVVTVDEPHAPRRAPYARPHDEQPTPEPGPDFVADSVATLAPGPPRIHEHVRGSAPRMLQLAARDAELLVIGRTDCADVLGPTARACVAHAACPVLVVAPSQIEDDVRGKPRFAATA